MSTLKVDNLLNAAGNESPISVPGAAKAWVKFNGTGTIAINDSFNVTSLTDHGTGQYSANFTNAMANANYAVAGMASDSGSASVVALSWESSTTSAVRVQCIRSSTGFSDQGIVNVVVFGG